MILLITEMILLTTEMQGRRIICTGEGAISQYS